MAKIKRKKGGASKKRWIQKATKRMKQKGTVGSLTRAAKRAGYSSALSYARHILANKSKYSSTMVKKAVFAVNANKRKK